LEVHLDLVGGMAGDMFIAALLDAFPEHEALVQQAIHSMFPRNDIVCSLVPHRDAVLAGRRFQVLARAPVAGGFDFSPPHTAHTTWCSIRARLEAASISPSIRRHATAIFQSLADAEGFVHGVDSADVSFHEVGAWDSIADIVGASALIAAIGAHRWTASPVPLGSGRVTTAHGSLPVPAPATTRLLLGMRTLDDGIAGERVTPTGAAILRHLCPPRAGSGATPARTLLASGAGFGIRTLPGLSNHLRVLCFDSAATDAPEARLLDVIEFEIDDQSGEDLSTGLERLRQHDAVLDIIQAPVFGKKGRLMVHVRVLARHAQVEDLIAACFRETTTIGLRHHVVRGLGLARRSQTVLIDGHRLRVKVVDRPGGATAKTESDDVLEHEDHARRAALRARAEHAALSATANAEGLEQNA